MKKTIILFLFILISFACFAQDQIPTGWENADLRWSMFANEHMDRMREHDLTLPRAKLPSYKFDMKWEELKNPIITKYLPDYKIFFDQRFVFVLDKSGHIICLGNFLPLNRAFESAPDLEVITYSDFIKKMRIKIQSPEDAIDMAKLMEAVLWGGRIEYEKSDAWRFKANRSDNSWIVNLDYVGPPANIFVPPTWKITLEEQGYFESITIGSPEF